MHNRQMAHENHDMRNTIEALQKKLFSHYEKIGQIEALVIANKADLAFGLAKILDIKVGPEKEIEDYSSIEVTHHHKHNGTSNKKGAAT
jgi:hypothetical protein